MSIPKDVIEAVRRKVSLAELASDLPKIKRSGRGYTACCPFHEDSSPSFSINDEEGIFHCFGCGKKGSVFDYAMERRNLTFAEAVRYLAGKVGVIIPEQRHSSGESQLKQKEKERRGLLREILTHAVNHYRQLLLSPEGKMAQDYFLRRGVSAESINIFQLGYAPASWDYIADVLWKTFQSRFDKQEDFIAELIALGLIKMRGKSIGEQGEVKLPSENIEGTDQRKNYYDVFRQRVIFPILRSDFVPIAVGGRILTNDKEQPKYINSPESLIYSKRSTLYGLAQSLPAIRKARHTYLVEGYLDVIGLHQRGLQLSIASCGTAVTEEHAQLLRRFVNRVTAFFDGDVAGRKAAAHCFSVFLNSGIEVDGVLLPEGEDPDSFCLVNDHDKLQKYIEEHRVPILTVYLDELLTNAGLQDGAGSAVIGGKAAQQFVREIVVVNNAVEKEYLLKEASIKFGVSVESMLSLLKEAEEKKREAQSYTHPITAHAVVRSAVREQVTDRRQPDWNRRYHDAEHAPKPQFIEAENNKGIADDYWKQMLILLVRQPSIAKSVLDTGLDRQAILNEQGKAGLLTDLCRDLVAGAYVGLESRENDEHSVAYKRIKQLIEKQGLSAEPILIEVQRQVRIGAVEPEKLLEDIARQIKRRKIEADVAQLKKEEAGISNDEELLRLAQEKLLKRRSLETPRKPLSKD
ncbi:MAG: DNA primase [Deltaproteobacteria bacterium]|nr:DNA primase [Deltaproteobacteria bacterium]